MSDLFLRLAQLVDERSTVLAVKGKKADVEQRKREGWKQITNAINSEFATKFTVSQVRDKYKYVKVRAKKKFAENKREMTKTGGGHSEASRISPAEELIIAGHQAKPSFSGLSYGIESSVSDEKENFHSGIDPHSTDDNIASTSFLNLLIDNEDAPPKPTAVDPLPTPTIPRDKKPSIQQLQREVLMKQLQLFEQQEKILDKVDKALDIFIKGNSI